MGFRLSCCFMAGHSAQADRKELNRKIEQHSQPQVGQGSRQNCAQRSTCPRTCRAPQAQTMQTAYAHRMVHLRPATRHIVTCESFQKGNASYPNASSTFSSQGLSLHQESRSGAKQQINHLQQPIGSPKAEEEDNAAAESKCNIDNCSREEACR